MSDYSEVLVKTYFIKMRDRRGPVSFASKDRTDGLRVIFKTGVVDELGLKMVVCGVENSTSVGT